MLDKGLDLGFVIILSVFIVFRKLRLFKVKVIVIDMGLKILEVI